MSYPFNTQQAQRIALGQADKDIIADTATHTGNWVVLYAKTDVVFDTLIDKTIRSGTMNGRTLYQGEFYWGHITSITLSSGVLIAVSGE